ncbi:MAG: ABC transporter substrate-binding protein [Actinobacteria bacterium]|nr:ABC transporter substrate-binding protein [Actinomycetota bacterium]
MRVERLRVVALVAVLALAGAACGGGGTTAVSPSAAGGGTIIHGTTDSIVSLDPAGQYDLGSAQISYQVYDTLLEILPQGNTPEPALATSCAYTDALTYSCTLRSDAKFSDGSPMTSADVAFSIKRNIEINNPNGACSLLVDLADCGKWKNSAIDTPDPQTVTFHLRNPDGAFPFILTTSAAFVVPAAVYPENNLQPDDQIIGTGRYKLVQYRPGEQVVLEKNPYFWGDPPLNDRVIVQYFDKSSALKLALEQGEVDVGWRTFTPTDVAAMKNEPGLQVLTGPGAEIRYMVFNTNLAPGKDIAVRQAAAMTIDRQAIADNVYNGTVQPLWSMVPSGLAGHVDAFKDLYGDAPDLQGAKKVLSDAGVKTPVPIEIWWTPTHYGDSSADEYAEIQRSLEGSGLFKVTLKSTEWDQYTTAAFTDGYPVYQLGWFPDYPDADNYVFTFYSSSSFLNDHYSNPKVEKLLADERATTDPAQRLKDFEEVQRIGAQDVPIIPIWEATQLAVARDGVTGVAQTLDVSYIFRYWLISKTS